MNSFSILSLIALVTVLNLSYVENCARYSKQFFPDTPAKAIAILKGVTADGALIRGTVSFTQNGLFDTVEIKVNITGLPTGLRTTKHGLHVHATGITTTSDDLATMCGSTGGHYNPTKQNHGDITADVRHVGDYGNFEADNNGNIIQTKVDKISEIYGQYSIVGRAVVLHQLVDDLGLVDNDGSRTTGNAGARIACGVIGIIN